MSNTIKSEHLHYFREALSFVEEFVKNTHTDICLFGNSDRIELSRMITINNKTLVFGQSVYKKLSEHFESQFLNDIDVEYFSEEEIKYFDFAFNLQIESLSASYKRLAVVTNNQMVLFNLNVEIGRVKMVMQDLKDIINILNTV